MTDIQIGIPATKPCLMCGEPLDIQQASQFCEPSDQEDFAGVSCEQQFQRTVCMDFTPPSDFERKENK